MFAWLSFFDMVKEQETARLSAAEDHVGVIWHVFFSLSLCFPIVKEAEKARLAAEASSVTFSSSEDLCFFDVCLRPKLLRRRPRLVGVIWYVGLGSFL